MRLFTLFIITSIFLFQSTHPCRVRRDNIERKLAVTYFNPRTRAGCDKSTRQSYHWSKISIHAPVQGATSIGCYDLCNCWKFQSTHPCRVRLDSDIFWFLCPYFNPRTRAGCDPTFGLPATTSVISIHAPVQGATGLGMVECWSGWIFQSTHPCRVRLMQKLMQNGLRLFQSTHPCRVRRNLIGLRNVAQLFQSTHPCRVRPARRC